MLGEEADAAADAGRLALPPLSARGYLYMLPAPADEAVDGREPWPEEEDTAAGAADAGLFRRSEARSRSKCWCDLRDSLRSAWCSCSALFML